jgi:hypothetical protein
MDRRTDTPKFTASKLAAMVAHESLWDAMHEDSRLEDFHYLSDRLARIQPTGDDHAGMVVQDGNQVPVKAIVFAGIEITDIHCPQDVGRQSFKGVPAASQACDRWHSESMLSQDTLHSIGGNKHTLVVEDIGQSLLAEAGILCFGT